MNPYSRHYKLKQSIVKFIHIHLFLTVCSLALLIWWGLPISLLALVGNFMANIFLTLFLALCSILFFTELIGVSNTLLVVIIEKITDFFNWMLSFGSAYWLIGCVKLPSYILLGIPLVVIFLSYYRWSHYPWRNIAGLFVILTTLFAGSRLCTHKTPYVEIIQKNTKKPFLLIVGHSKTYAVDPGSLAANPAAESWVLYTLAPEIIKKTGKSHIDTLLLCHPSLRTFQALTTLLSVVQIKTILVPIWSGNTSYKNWKAYKEFLLQAREHNCTIKRLPANHEYVIQESIKLTVTTQEKRKKNASIAYPHCIVTHQIDNEIATLYSSKKKLIAPEGGPI